MDKIGGRNTYIHSLNQFTNPLTPIHNRFFIYIRAHLSSLIHHRIALPLRNPAIKFLRSATKQRISLEEETVLSNPSGSYLGHRTLKWPPPLPQMRSPPSPLHHPNRANSAKSILPPTHPHPPQKTSHLPKSAKHGLTSSPAAQVA